MDAHAAYGDRASSLESGLQEGDLQESKAKCRSSGTLVTLIHILSPMPSSVLPWSRHSSAARHHRGLRHLLMCCWPLSSQEDTLWPSRVK